MTKKVFLDFEQPISDLINKIEELLKQPKCDFVLYVGNKKLVKRKEFEQYISKSLEI